MNNTTIVLKIKERLNKLDSQDFNNIPTWKILEAFNKSQVSWVRNSLRGINNLKEGDESSLTLIEDFSILIPDPLPMSFIDKGLYFQSNLLPADFLRYKRIALMGVNKCCSELKRFNVELAEEANVDVYLDDVNRRPDYAWGETFFTLTGNKINLYHDNQFEISTCDLIYYRQPKRIQMTGVADVYTGNNSTEEVLCEFHDDAVELLVVEAATTLAGDIESQIQMSRLAQEDNRNN